MVNLYAQFLATLDLIKLESSGNEEFVNFGGYFIRPRSDTYSDVIWGYTVYRDNYFGDEIKTFETRGEAIRKLIELGIDQAIRAVV